MKRSNIRDLKRAVRKQNDSAAMQLLLERSIKFGHRRLALLRCIQAEQMGVAVNSETSRYCHEIADQMPRAQLEQIIRFCRNKHKRQSGHA